MLKTVKKIAAGVVLGLTVFAWNNITSLANGYRFKVTNNGDKPILRIEACEIGKSNWGRFANSAIRPGDTITLEWDKSTDNTDCRWRLRAVYSDGPSEAATFNFCEETEIEFNN